MYRHSTRKFRHRSVPSRVLQKGRMTFIKAHASKPSAADRHFRVEELIMSVASSGGR